MIYLEPVVGQEIHSHEATRPCVVISSDSLRKREIRTIVPVTNWQTKYEKDPLRVFLAASATNGLTKDSAADATQVRTVSLERFDWRCGSVVADELEEVVLAVGIVIEHP